jgi:hypothetical protein
LKITHLNSVKKPQSIVVRNYGNEKTVTFACEIPIHKNQNLDFELGYWKIKYKDFVHKEYEYLKTLTHEIN